MQHLLVLCSQTSLIVLGLAAPENSAPAASTSEGPAQPLSQEFVVYDTELRFPTDNVAMNSIVSTKAGRVFMCGLSDGHLYEMQYQATEGWFGGKSSLHNHSVSGVTSFLPSIFSSASSGKPLTSPYHVLWSNKRVLKISSPNWHWTNREIFYMLSPQRTPSSFTTYLELLRPPSSDLVPPLIWPS